MRRGLRLTLVEHADWFLFVVFLQVRYCPAVVQPERDP